LKKPVALLLGLAAFSFVGDGTAAAQGLYYYGPGFYGRGYAVPGLASWRIARIVRAAGMTPLSGPVRRGPTYEVVALDPEGRHVRVMVDAYDGAITSVRPVAALRPNGEPYAAPPPRMTGVPSSEEAEAALGARPAPIAPAPYGALRPPQGLPPQAQPQATPPAQATQPLPNLPPSNQRFANAPAVTGATAPTENQHTPIPRPRPSAAATAAVAPSQTPAATPSTAAAGPADVPEAPPAPTRAHPAAAAPSAAAAPPASSAKTATSSTPAAKSETARPATTLVPVAPLE